MDINYIKFTLLCKIGDMDSAQQIVLSHLKDDLNFNIFFKTSYTFKMSYLTKWIYYNAKVDIRYNNDYVYTKACFNKDIDMINWLQNLCDYYSIDTVDGKINPIIMTDDEYTKYKTKLCVERTLKFKKELYEIIYDPKNVADFHFD